MAAKSVHFNLDAHERPENAFTAQLRPACGAKKRGALVTGAGANVTCPDCKALVGREAR